MDLGALGAVGPGYMQGQEQLQNIQSRAMQIQQMQAQLDEQKKQLAGQAALGRFLAMGGSQPQPQPPMPGAPSQPAQPPQGAPGGPPMAGPSPTGQGIPPMQTATGGPPMPPQPQQPTVQGAPPGGNVSRETSPNDFSPQGETALLLSIAKQIKQASPGIDDRTLLSATSQFIDQLKSVAGAQRPAVMAFDTGLRTQTQRDIAHERATVAIRGQDLRLEEVGQQVQGAMSRAQMIQRSIDSRFTSGQASKQQTDARRDRLRALTAQLQAGSRQLASLQGALVSSDDPRYASAGKQISDAMDGLDRLEDVTGKTGPSSDADGGDGSGLAPPKVSPSSPSSTPPNAGQLQSQLKTGVQEPKRPANVPAKAIYSKAQKKWWWQDANEEWHHS